MPELEKLEAALDAAQQRHLQLDTLFDNLEDGRSAEANDIIEELDTVENEIQSLIKRISRLTT